MGRGERSKCWCTPCPGSRHSPRGPGRTGSSASRRAGKRGMSARKPCRWLSGFAAIVAGMRTDLTGKVALVAGGTRGASRAIAVELGRAGATVYVTGRTSGSQRSEVDRPETIEGTAGMIAEAGGTGITVRVDHLDPGQVEALAVTGDARPCAARYRRRQLARCLAPRSRPRCRGGAAATPRSRVPPAPARPRSSRRVMAGLPGQVPPPRGRPR
jgi:hypothetical protein